MTSYNFLVIAHLLGFAYWLGSDLGVFYSSRFVANKSLPIEARKTAAAIMHFLDYWPRLCLILLLPIGVTMAAMLGLLPLENSHLWIIWVVSLAWLVVASMTYFAHGQSWVSLLTKIDWVLRLGAIFAMLGLGIAAFGGLAGIPQTPWLGLKCIIYATVIFSGVCLRLVVKGFGEPFGRIMAGQATDADEAFVKSRLGRARPFVFYIWIGVFVIGLIGVSKVPV